MCMTSQKLLQWKKRFMANISSYENKMPMSQNYTFMYQIINISEMFLIPFFTNVLILPNSTLYFCHEII